MDKNRRGAPVQFREHRFELVISQIVAAVVSDHHHAVCVELIERESYFGQRRCNIIHGQRRQQAETRWPLLDQRRAVFVDATSLILRKRHRQRKQLCRYVVPVHEIQRELWRPGRHRRRDKILRGHSARYRPRRDEVRVNVNSIRFHSHLHPRKDDQRDLRHHGNCSGPTSSTIRAA